MEAVQAVHAAVPVAPLGRPWESQEDLKVEVVMAVAAMVVVVSVVVVMVGVETVAAVMVEGVEVVAQQVGRMGMGVVSMVDLPEHAADDKEAVARVVEALVLAAVVAGSSGGMAVVVVLWEEVGRAEVASVGREVEVAASLALL